MKGQEEGKKVVGLGFWYERRHGILPLFVLVFSTGYACDVLVPPVGHVEVVAELLVPSFEFFEILEIEELMVPPAAWLPGCWLV